MSERDWADEKAGQLVRKIAADLDLGPGPISLKMALEGEERATVKIAAAIREAASVPEGHVRTPDGVVRKVNTTGWDPGDPDKAVPLPVYADGELWMMGEEAYTVVDGEVREFYTYDHNPSWTSSGWVLRWGDGEIELNKCYSTRDSAEAARSKRQ